MYNICQMSKKALNYFEILQRFSKFTQFLLKQQVSKLSGFFLFFFQESIVAFFTL